MPEAIERQTEVNRGSPYFKGDWLIEYVVPTQEVEACIGAAFDLEEFANAAFVYLLQVETESTNYEIKLWNTEARHDDPILHLVKAEPITNYRRLFLYVDEDRAAKLHIDILNNDAVAREFDITLHAVRQI